MKVRKAIIKDIDAIMKIIEEAKAFLKNKVMYSKKIRKYWLIWHFVMEKMKVII